MAIDAYVKFGESSDRSPLYGTPLPLIEGDSDDAAHHWWCELRDCGFDLENPNPNPTQASDGGGPPPDPKKESKAGYKPVVLKKRVDWGSYLLFQKCCEAAPAEDTVEDAEPDKAKPGVIDQVTVHICRPDGQGNKIPFITVFYFGVTVTNFKIGMSGPESSETITFEFNAIDFRYTQTDPYTGAAMPGQPRSTGVLTNHTMDPASPQSGAGSSGGSGASGSPSGNGASQPLLVGATATVDAHVGDGGASGGSTSISGVATATDAALASGYPGLWGENGFGVLPD